MSVENPTPAPAPRPTIDVAQVRQTLQQRSAEVEQARASAPTATPEQRTRIQRLMQVIRGDLGALRANVEAVRRATPQTRENLDRLGELDQISTELATVDTKAGTAHLKYQGLNTAAETAGTYISSAASAAGGAMQFVNAKFLAPIGAAINSMGSGTWNFIKKIWQKISPQTAGVAELLPGITPTQTPDQLNMEANFTAMMGLVTNNGLQVTIPETPKQTLMAQIEALLSIYRSNRGDMNVTRDAYVLLVIAAAKRLTPAKTAYTWAELMTVASTEVNDKAVRIPSYGVPPAPTPTPPPAPAPAPAPRP